MMPAINKHAKRTVIAVPMASQESLNVLQTMVDEIIVLDDPANFRSAVGSHYLEFEQVSDDKVKRYLRELANRYD